MDAAGHSEQPVSCFSLREQEAIYFFRSIVPMRTFSDRLLLKGDGGMVGPTTIPLLG